ncbi:transposase family [Shigella sonnei]|nr:transposase family [Shigella sonnei]
MSRKTQRYSKEFKAEAVRTVPENQLSISEGASRLSLPEGTLGQWVTAARKGLGTPGSRTVAELESEILQLRKALNEARLERDILKKATAYFAQESLKNRWHISALAKHMEPGGSRRSWQRMASSLVVTDWK